MADNAADRKDIRRREKQAKIDDALRADVVRSIMSTTQGREWMWHQLAQARIFASTFNGDALQSAFNEGQRAMGLALLADILTTCPDQYIQAQREANVRDTLSERRSSPQPDGRDSGRETGSDSDSGPHTSADTDPYADPDGSYH